MKLLSILPSIKKNYNPRLYNNHEGIGMWSILPLFKTESNISKFLSILKLEVDKIVKSSMTINAGGFANENKN